MSTTHKVVLVGAGLVVSYVVLQLAWSAWFAQRSKSLEAVSLGERELGAGPPLTVFVAGDSLGAGLGASSFETSIAGLVALDFAHSHRVLYRNVSRSGARLADVGQQPVPDREQDLVLLVAGSNDLFHFTGADQTRSDARSTLARYKPLATTLVLIGPGVVHDAGAIPLIVRPLYAAKRPSYVEALRAACAEVGALYVDPAEVAPQFDEEPGDTVSRIDRFHLSDDGHRWWARRILDELADSGELLLRLRTPPTASDQGSRAEF